MNVAQIIKNAATSYGRLIVTTVSALLLTPFLLHHLGAEPYGLWGLAQAISGYFGLMDLGITSASVRYIAHYRALKDWDSLNAVLGSSYVCYGLMAVVTLLISAVVAQLSPVFFPHSILHLQLRVLIYVVGVVAAVGFLTVLPMQCVLAAQRQDLINRWLLLFQVASAVSTFVFVQMGKGVIVLALILLANTLLNGLVGYVLMRKVLPQARLMPKWHPSQAKVIFKFAGWAFVSSVATRVIYCTDTLIIGAAITMTAVAGYMIIQKIVELMRSVVITGAGVVGTFVSEQSALGESDSLTALWVEGSKWSLAALLPVWIACLVLPKEIIESWVKQCAPGCDIALIWLASATLFDLTQCSGFQVLLNSGRHKLVALAMAFEAIANFALSIALVKPLGVVGVAIGTFFPSAIRSIFLMYAMSCESGMSVSVYLRKALAPGALVGLPPVLLILGYKFLSLHRGRVSLSYLIICASMSLLASMFFIGFSGKQRKKVIQELRRRVLKQSVPDQPNIRVTELVISDVNEKELAYIDGA